MTIISSAEAAALSAADPMLTASQGDRDVLKHLLIGSPRAIRHTIHRLHNLRYAEAGFWSPLIAIPQQELILTANQGEMMSLLMRYVRFE